MDMEIDKGAVIIFDKELGLEFPIVAVYEDDEQQAVLW